jgi:hypothetical protein
MSVLDFPTSPTNGQYYGGYIWNAANETWDSSFAPRAATIPISTPNYVINSAFDIWQRGTSFSNVSSVTYTADRWWVGKDATATLNVTRESLTPGISSTFGFESEYSLRFNVSSWTSLPVYLTTRVEDVRTLSGQTATLSYWAKSNVSVTNTPLLVQAFGSGGSPVVATSLGSSASITTSWQKFTHTFVLPSVSGKTIGAGSFIDLQVLRFSQAAVVDIAGVQLEAGAAPTEFRRNAPSIAAELAACQRYYYRLNVSSIGTGGNPRLATGYVLNSTAAEYSIKFAVPMRTVPTSFDSSNANTFATYNATSGLLRGTGMISAPTDCSNETGHLQLTITGGSLTQSQAIGFLNFGGTSAFIGWSAEL